MRSRTMVLAGVAGLAIAAALPAHAQVSPAPADAQIDDTDTDEIVVTARKRSERLQDVPVAVSAISDASLHRQQIADISDLSLAAPSVLVTQTAGSANAAQIFIRGFGQDALGFNSETPVGIYFDDVYLGRVQGSLLDILDIERVEILRGPQGTLYGRNSTTGAVKFVVRRPDLNEVRARGEVTLGSHNRADFRGTVSVPIVPGTLAAKFDFVSRNQDGYVEGVDATGKPNGLLANGMSRSLFRAALNWKPSETVQVDIAGDYSRDRSGSFTGTAITCVAGPNSACSPKFGSPLKTGINHPGLQHSKSMGLTGKVTVDLGFAELKSTSAYRTLDGLDPIDLSVTPGAPSTIHYGQTQNQFSQELQLVSSGDGPLNFAVGLFYFQENWTTDTNFLNLRRNLDTQKAHSYAAYGEVYYKPFPRFSITLGGRITRDTKSIDRKIFSPRTAVSPTVSVLPASYAQNVFTPKVAVDYKPTDDLLVYASWSRGYRPGGYGNTWPSNALAAHGIFAAEETESFDGGVKASLIENRLTIDLAAYRINYKNLQQGQLTPTEFVITSSDARVKGIELEATLRPVSGLSLFGNLGLLDDKITRSNLPGDNLSRRLRYAPRTTFKIGGEYSVPFDGDGNSAFANVNYARVSTTAMDQANSLGLMMPGYGLLDAQIGFRSGSGLYRVTIGGRNLTNQVYWRSGVPGAARYYGQPRTFNVTLAARL